MPRLEPVMTATVPARSNGVFFIAWTPFLFSSLFFFVMPGLVPGSHVFKIGPKVETPVAGINPGMTKPKGSAMKSITVATLALLTATPALAQQGVSPTEIVVEIMCELLFLLASMFLGRESDSER